MFDKKQNKQARAKQKEMDIGIGEARVELVIAVDYTTKTGTRNR